jgi:hypothetical protein
MSTDAASEAANTSEHSPLLRDSNILSAGAQTRQASSSLIHIFQRMRGGNNTISIQRDETSEVGDRLPPIAADVAVSNLLSTLVSVLTPTSG